MRLKSIAGRVLSLLGHSLNASSDFRRESSIPFSAISFSYHRLVELFQQPRHRYPLSLWLSWRQLWFKKELTRRVQWLLVSDNRGGENILAPSAGDWGRWVKLESMAPGRLPEYFARSGKLKTADLRCRDPGAASSTTPTESNSSDFNCISLRRSDSRGNGAGLTMIC